MSIVLHLVGLVCLLIDASKPEPWLTHIITSLIDPSQYNNAAVDDFLNNMNRILHCCGGYGENDYIMYDRSPPDSCFDNWHAGKPIFSTGCGEALSVYLKSWAAGLGAVSVWLLTLQIIASVIVYKMNKIIRAPDKVKIVKSLEDYEYKPLPAEPRLSVPEVYDEPSSFRDPPPPPVPERIASHLTTNGLQTSNNLNQETRGYAANERNLQLTNQFQEWEVNDHQVRSGQVMHNEGIKTNIQQTHYKAPSNDSYQYSWSDSSQENGNGKISLGWEEGNITVPTFKSGMSTNMNKLGIPDLSNRNTNLAGKGTGFSSVPVHAKHTDSELDTSDDVSSSIIDVDSSLQFSSEYSQDYQQYRPSDIWNLPSGKPGKFGKYSSGYDSTDYQTEIKDFIRSYRPTQYQAKNEVNDKNEKEDLYIEDVVIKPRPIIPPRTFSRQSSRNESFRVALSQHNLRQPSSNNLIREISRSCDSLHDGFKSLTRTNSDATSIHSSQRSLRRGYGSEKSVRMEDMKDRLNHSSYNKNREGILRPELRSKSIGSLQFLAQGLKPRSRNRN